jgi:hypothetical protein
MSNGEAITFLAFVATLTACWCSPAKPIVRPAMAVISRSPGMVDEAARLRPANRNKRR